ncbi:MAG: GTPase ObgE [bacterium]|nr:GTPase ObgE [bacterium]
MIDSVQISLKAGRGGNGQVSFNRMTGKTYGPPDGGNGGKGADLYLEATSDLNTLLPFRFSKVFEAENGENGGKNNRQGAAGSDRVLKVPVGTILKSIKGEKLFDLEVEGKKVLVVQGGKGGRGNAHLPHSQLSDPRPGKKWDYLKTAEKGAAGEVIELNLELQVLADVGLIGLPNVGKSTLLSRLTAAKPKIADYPFTTLEPNLGVMNYGRGNTQSLVLADIPGLIEGASEGKGLGDQFLRHIERTKLLVHVLAVNEADLLKNYQTIREELKAYDPTVTTKKEIVVLNKADLVTPKEMNEKVKQLSKLKIKPLVISAAAEIGLDELKKKIVQASK